MKKLTKKQITDKVKKIDFPNFDLIIAINRGGLNPAKILAKHLKLKIKTIHINYRDETHAPKYKNPKLIKTIKIKNKKILLVDDVSRTGKTLRTAKKLLKENKVKTFVINGKADYSLYNCKECFKFPW
ncbi:phosphoribosyltransferase [Candidatus Woesearchaeota archaeon]|nr:phosphoribosyltransferase [Candidatus Woesearchaeota archaeon]